MFCIFLESVVDICIRHFISCQQIKQIYHAIFASHMTYGCQIWGQTYNNTHINKIQTLQNNALRLICFASDFRDHITPTYVNLSFLKIKDLISQKNLLLIHDYFLHLSVIIVYAMNNIV